MDALLHTITTDPTQPPTQMVQVTLMLPAGMSADDLLAHLGSSVRIGGPGSLEREGVAWEVHNDHYPEQATEWSDEQEAHDIARVCSTGDAPEHWQHHVTRVERTRVRTYTQERDGG